MPKRKSKYKISKIEMLGDLPEYIKRYNVSHYQGGIRIVFPQGYQITEQDVEVLPKAKKWIKEHGGGYDDRGFWFIPIERRGGV